MCCRFLCIVCTIIACLCVELRSASAAGKPLNAFLGRWTSEIFQTELGPMQQELLFLDNGVFHLQTFMPDDENTTNYSCVHNNTGNYTKRGNKLIFTGLGKGHVIKLFRFDNQGRLFLRYKSDEEVRYSRSDF